MLERFHQSYSGWFVYKYISSPERRRQYSTIDVIIITETWLIELEKTIIITNWTNILGWQRHKNSIYFAWLIFLWFSIRNKTFDTFDNMFLEECRKVRNTSLNKIYLKQRPNSLATLHNPNTKHIFIYVIPNTPQNVGDRHF